jgi:class 3 adenylate cyclase
MHTGYAIVGNMGSETNDQFTAIGPDVNIASRLEGLAQPGQIIISSTTESRIKNRYNVKRISANADSENRNDAIILKHVGGTFQLYEIVDRMYTDE